MTEILKQWTSNRLTCKVWQEPHGAFRGCVFANGKPVFCAESLEKDGLAIAVKAVEALAALTSAPPGIQLISETTPFVDIALALAPNAGMPDEERLTTPVQILDDVEVLPPDWNLFRALTSACDPPGVNKGEPIDLRWPLYSFVRKNAPRDPMYHWDSDQRLQFVITISRIVRPTSLGLLYATRLIGHFGSPHCRLIPGPVRGFGAHAWVADPARDWLSRSDLGRLGILARAFFLEPFPPRSRLQTALWYFEYAARTNLVNVRWLFVVTAIETLVSTDSSQSTRHFTRRLPELAARRGVPCSARDASRMWALRSAISHGDKKDGVKPSDLAVYARVEEVLRATLEQAILDPDWRKQFDSRESIDRAFPVAAPQQKVVKCAQCGSEVLW